MGSFVMAERKRDYRKALKLFIHGRTNGKCGYCGVDIPEQGFSIDHIDPYGDDDVDNYIACCRSCNSTKGQKNIEDFREYAAVKSLHPEIKLPGNVSLWLKNQEWYPHKNYVHTFHFEEDES